VVVADGVVDEVVDHAVDEDRFAVGGRGPQVGPYRDVVGRRPVVDAGEDVRRDGWSPATGRFSVSGRDDGRLIDFHNLLILTVE
jgi:hypothetical protein